jgi:hypothetical protein
VCRFWPEQHTLAITMEHGDAILAARWLEAMHRLEERASRTEDAGSPSISVFRAPLYVRSPNNGRSRVPATLPMNAAGSHTQPCTLADAMPLKYAPMLQP